MYDIHNDIYLYSVFIYIEYNMYLYNMYVCIYIYRCIYIRIT